MSSLIHFSKETLKTAQPPSAHDAAPSPSLQGITGGTSSPPELLISTCKRNMRVFQHFMFAFLKVKMPAGAEAASPFPGSPSTAWCAPNLTPLLPLTGGKHKDTYSTS